MKERRDDESEAEFCQFIFFKCCRKSALALDMIGVERLNGAIAIPVLSRLQDCRVTSLELSRGTRDVLCHAGASYHTLCAMKQTWFGDVFLFLFRVSREPLFIVDGHHSRQARSGPCKRD